MMRGGEREAVHLTGIERQLKAEVERGRFRLALIQKPGPPEANRSDTRIFSGPPRHRFRSQP